MEGNTGEFSLMSINVSKMYKSRNRTTKATELRRNHQKN